MITLLDRYGFVKQMQIELPPGTQSYHMACYRTPVSTWQDINAVFATDAAIEKRTFYRQGQTNVFQER